MSNDRERTNLPKNFRQFSPEVREELQQQHARIEEELEEARLDPGEDWRWSHSQAFLEADKNELSLANRNRQCSATTFEGERCKSLAMPESPFCYTHRWQKRAGRGIEHFKFKTGRQSKYLPKHLHDRAIEQLNDPELLALDETIAIAGARLTELYERLNDSAPINAKGWELVMEALDQIDFLLQDEEPQVGAALERIQRLRHQAAVGSTEEKAWRQIAAMWEQRRKLIESERKRLLEMQQMMTAADIMALAIRLMESVKRNVRDQNVLEAIQRDFASTIGYRPLEHKPIPGTEHLFGS